MKHKIVVLIESTDDEQPGDRYLYNVQRNGEWATDLVITEGHPFEWPFLAVREVEL